MLPQADYPQFEVLLVGIVINLINIVIIGLGNRIDMRILRPMRILALIGNGLTLVMVFIIGVLGIALVMGGRGSPSAVEAAHDITVSGITHVLAIMLSIGLIIALDESI